MRADAGYAGFQHNPFSASYETFNGRDEPYSLRELAAFVELPPLAPRRKADVRSDGRNVETFDRLRMRTATPRPSITAKSVAGRVWSRYDGGHLTRVRADEAVRRENDRKRAVAVCRARGSLPREVCRPDSAARVVAAKLRGLGVAVDEIARRLSAGVRSVQRWISEIGLLVPYATDQTMTLELIGDAAGDAWRALPAQFPRPIHLDLRTSQCRV